MKRKVNIIGAILFCVGLLVVLGALICAGFAIDKIANINETTVEFKEDFESIFVDTSNVDIIVKPATDGRGKMDIKYENGIEVAWKIKNGVLNIKEETAWYKKVLNFGNSSVTIYLGAEQYNSIKVDGSNTDVNIDGVGFESAEIYTSTGDITINANILSTTVDVSTGDVMINNLNGKRLSVTTSTGDVTLKGTALEGDAIVDTTTGEVLFDRITVGGSIKIEVSTGDIEGKNTVAKNLEIKSSTGEVDLAGVVLSGNMKLETRSGDVELERCDAATMEIETSSGDIEGSLLTSKIFYTATNTGDVSVPKSTVGGLCQVTTKSGDIEFSIVK